MVVDVVDDVVAGDVVEVDVVVVFLMDVVEVVEVVDVVDVVDVDDLVVVTHCLTVTLSSSSLNRVFLKVKKYSPSSAGVKFTIPESFVSRSRIFCRMRYTLTSTLSRSLPVLLSVTWAETVSPRQYSPSPKTSTDM